MLVLVAHLSLISFFPHQPAHRLIHHIVVLLTCYDFIVVYLAYLVQKRIVASRRELVIFATVTVIYMLHRGQNL